MNMKGGTGIPFTAEIAYLGNRDRNNFVLQERCSAQNSAKMSTAQHGHDGNLAGCVDLLPTMVQVRVLRLILIYLDGLSIVTIPVLSIPLVQHYKVVKLGHERRDSTVLKNIS